MGFFDRVFRGERTHLSPNTAVLITERGRAELAESGGDDRSRILLALETRGSSDLRRISGATGLSEGQIERTLAGLLRNGLVRLMEASSDEEGNLGDGL